MTETTFLILLALFQPNHGYGIMQFIEKETNGRVLLGAGTLYGAINTMLKKGWITQLENGDANKKEYIISELGKVIAADELRRIEGLREMAFRIFGF